MDLAKSPDAISGLFLCDYLFNQRLIDVPVLFIASQASLLNGIEESAMMWENAGDVSDMDIRSGRMRQTVWLFVWILSVMLNNACVPVPFVDTDVRYERLQKGLYFLVVTGAPESTEEDIQKRWHQQAFHLCGGEYQDNAQLYERQTELHRHRSADFKQYRGDVRCDVSAVRSP